jgi:hypothetical protein
VGEKVLTAKNLRPSIFVADYFDILRGRKVRRRCKMFQSMIEETKNNLNKPKPMASSTVIQSFYDGANVFITGGTGELASVCQSHDR